MLSINVIKYLHSVYISPYVCSKSLRHSMFDNSRQTPPQSMSTNKRHYAFFKEKIINKTSKNT